MLEHALSLSFEGCPAQVDRRPRVKLERHLTWTDTAPAPASSGQLHLNQDPETHPRRTYCRFLLCQNLAGALRAWPDRSTSHDTINSVTELSTKGKAASHFHHHTHHRVSYLVRLVDAPLQVPLPGLVWPPHLLHGITSLSNPTRTRPGAPRLPTSASHGVAAPPHSKVSPSYSLASPSPLLFHPSAAKRRPRHRCILPRRSPRLSLRTAAQVAVVTHRHGYWPLLLVYLSFWTLQSLELHQHLFYTCWFPFCGGERGGRLQDIRLTRQTNGQVSNKKHWFALRRHQAPCQTGTSFERNHNRSSFDKASHNG